MPWWFWIITHLWILSSGIVFTVGIKDDEIGVSSGREALYSIGIVTFAPFIIIIGIGVVIWDELIKVKIHEWITRDNWLRKLGKRMKDKKQKKEDFKEMEDNEDEWRIERLGIKLK